MNNQFGAYFFQLDKTFIGIYYLLEKYGFLADEREGMVADKNLRISEISSVADKSQLSCELINMPRVKSPRQGTKFRSIS